MDAQVAQGPALPTKPKPDAVRVTSVDANLALPWDKMFDGCPFSAVPAWIDSMLQARGLIPHTTGGTDYAQWHVVTPDGVKNARPGDWIVLRSSGELDVCAGELADAVRATRAETVQDKTERNWRVQARYDELMAEGKHGHYETMFRVVREELDRARSR
jgi:hypothetical protein